MVYSRSKGWWQVYKDQGGLGIVDDAARRGWVPAGCLLETSVPPVTVAEATVLASAQPGLLAALPLASLVIVHSPSCDAPILRRNIVSKSYPGIALMDRLLQGDHEVDLVKGDTVHVFKRYNHWIYVRFTLPLAH